MWNLTKGKIFLSGISTTQLKKLYGTEKNAKAKVRLLAAIHRKNGRSLDEIAELAGHARSTVHNWLQRFQERSIEAKDAIKQTGRPAQLTEQQRVNLGLNPTEQCRKPARKKPANRLLKTLPAAKYHLKMTFKNKSLLPKVYDDL